MLRIREFQEHIGAGLKVKGEMMEKDMNYHDLLSVSHLQMIMELSGCTPGQFKDPCSNLCRHAKYRSYDGQCNNLDRPMQGVSLTPFKRLLQPIYENDFNTPVGWNIDKLYRGFRKPNARSVSLQVISSAHVEADEGLSVMTMQWGQFIDHDLDFSIGAPARQTFTAGAICNATCRNDAPCFNIQMPVDDPRRKGRSQQCMEFERSSAVCGSGETSVIFRRVARREQLNAITSYIDASQIYGSSETEALDLRDLFSDHGLLRYDIVSAAQKPYLPFNRDAPVDCQRNNSQNHPFRCFQAGDGRANEQLGLLSMHTIWLREHNRIAAELLVVNPAWDGEKIFQEARKILGAQIQHITYQHWLPKIFGPHYDRLIGPYMGYNQSVDSAVANGFATAAFRFGHGLINPVLYRFNEHMEPLGHLPLHHAFFSPERLLSEGGVDPILRGLYMAPMKAPRPDQLLNEELTERLFDRAHHVALDLAALNIQRGRDHALPEYMDWRQWCGLSVAEKWEDMEDIRNPKIVEKLRNLYGHPGNMDLWVGGMLEELLVGAKVGPTFACIIADQFRRTRAGDRLWFENPGVFTSLQLDEIKKRTLAKILCDNGDSIHRVQMDVFEYVGRDNADKYVPCEEHPRLNLNLWQDCACAEACGAYAREDAQAELLPEEELRDHHQGRVKRDAPEDGSSVELLRLGLEGVEAAVSEIRRELSSLRSELGRWEKVSGPVVSRCLVDGQSVDDGDTWAPDLCTSCNCTQGQVWCRQQSCPVLSCPQPHLSVPFQCCPVCPD